MYDHIGLQVRDLDAAQRFYRAALEPLGHVADDSGAGFGPAGSPALWLHLDARAKGGAPGVRADYSPSYYAAFLLDPDGNNIEAVCLK